MSTIIERYIYDVTRRLPEAEREDVKRELNANILDMLPENPTDDDMRKTLEGLGSPAKLAESYRQHPRCLISQSLYDEYISTLKLVLPVVGTICLIFGLATGFGKAMTESTAAIKWAQALITGGLTMCASGLVQAFMWTTIGFAIADRAGHKTEEQWNIDKLPKELPLAKNAISLSDGIAETALSAVFTALGVCVLSGRIPFVMSFSALDSGVVTLFNAQAAAPCIPAVIFAGIIAVIAGVGKIIYRRWNAFVCCANLANSIAGLCAALFILTRPNLWSDSLTEFLGETGTRYSEGNFFSACAASGARPLTIVTGIVAAAIFTFFIVAAVVRTVRTFRGK